MALPTELAKVRTRLSAKAIKTVNERNLLAELESLDARLLNEAVRGIETSVTKSAGSGADCPCCGR